MSLQGSANLFSYLVARCCNALWAGGRIWLLKVMMMKMERLPPWRQGLEFQTTRRRESVESPRWEHDPITGLCNRSEPHSALYNGIRSARCSQLDRQCHCDTKQCGSKHNFMHTAAVSEGRVQQVSTSMSVQVPKYHHPYTKQWDRWLIVLTAKFAYMLTRTSKTS